jgi:hypothetical protein
MPQYNITPFFSFENKYKLIYVYTQKPIHSTHFDPEDAAAYTSETSATVIT